MSVSLYTLHPFYRTTVTLSLCAGYIAFGLKIYPLYNTFDCHINFDKSKSMLRGCFRQNFLGHSANNSDTTNRREKNDRKMKRKYCKNGDRQRETLKQINLSIAFKYGKREAIK